MLQRAEQRTEVEGGRYPFPGHDIDRGPQPPYDIQEPPPPGPFDIPNLKDMASPRSISANGSLSESENEERGPEKAAGRFQGTQPRSQTNSEYADFSNDEQHPTTIYQESALQSQPKYKGDVGSIRTRTSTLLLEMVPYKPRTSDTAYYHRPNYLISAKPSESARSNTDPKPAMEEATKSVRLLLDKWTTSGSAPVASLLDHPDE